MSKRSKPGSRSRSSRTRGPTMEEAIDALIGVAYHVAPLLTGNDTDVPLVTIVREDETAEVVLIRGGDEPEVLVVEPDHLPALLEAMDAQVEPRVPTVGIAFVPPAQVPDIAEGLASGGWDHALLPLPFSTGPDGDADPTVQDLMHLADVLEIVLTGGLEEALGGKPPPRPVELGGDRGWVQVTWMVERGPIDGEVHELEARLGDATRTLRLRGGATLGELHALLQAAYGWAEQHPHELRAGDRRYGIPEDEGYEDALDEDEARLDAVAPAGATLEYRYGDDAVVALRVIAVHPAADDEPAAALVGGAGDAPATGDEEGEVFDAEAIRERIADIF